MCIIFMLKSHFWAQVSLSFKIYRLILHNSFNMLLLFPTSKAVSFICISVSVIPCFLTHTILTCYSHLECYCRYHFLNLLFCSLTYSPYLFPSSTLTSNLYQIGTTPFTFMILQLNHLQSCYISSLCCKVDFCLWTPSLTCKHPLLPFHLHCHTSFKSGSHKYSVTSFSFSKLSFNIFTTWHVLTLLSIMLTNTAFLFPHIPLSVDYFLILNCTFSWGHQMSFLFSLCFALYSKWPVLNVLFVLIFCCFLPSSSHNIYQKDKLLILF